MSIIELSFTFFYVTLTQSCQRRRSLFQLLAESVLIFAASSDYLITNRSAYQNSIITDKQFSIKKVFHLSETKQHNCSTGQNAQFLAPIFCSCTE